LKRPDNWGGIELSIKEIEFWQGRENRLHNRIICCLTDDLWDIQILSP
jgi:pyridoxamine 5'-phosphate oxidase